MLDYKNALEVDRKNIAKMTRAYNIKNSEDIIEEMLEI